MNTEQKKRMGRPAKGRRMVPVTVALAKESVTWIQDHVNNTSAWIRGLILAEQQRHAAGDRQQGSGDNAPQS